MKEAYIAAKERWARKMAGQHKPTPRSTDRDILGFWEIRGYSNTADPWTEDRFAKKGEPPPGFP
jgi:hypothetical protein